MITGTYSSVGFDPVVNELYGSELKIVNVGSTTKYQGAFQLCDGGPGYLHVVDIELANGNAITFALPDSPHLPFPKGVVFKGIITRRGLDGTYWGPAGEMSSLHLERRRSYWD